MADCSCHTDVILHATHGTSSKAAPSKAAALQATATQCGLSHFAAGRGLPDADAADTRRPSCSSSYRPIPATSAANNNATMREDPSSQLPASTASVGTATFADSWTLIEEDEMEEHLSIMLRLCHRLLGQAQQPLRASCRDKSCEDVDNSFR